MKKKNRAGEPVIDGKAKPERVRPTRFDMIANQMIKGFTMRALPPAEVVAGFKERYRDVIQWVDDNSPQHLPLSRFSVGVLGAIGKAALWYGTDRMSPFCDALKNKHFQGHGDPAHVLYLWLMNQSRNNTKEAYRRTVTAIRYFIDGRQMMRRRDGVESPNSGKLNTATTDLFTWDAGFVRMVMRHSNTSKTQIKIYTPQGVVAV